MASCRRRWALSRTELPSQVRNARGSADHRVGPRLPTRRDRSAGVRDGLAARSRVSRSFEVTEQIPSRRNACRAAQPTPERGCPPRAARLDGGLELQPRRAERDDVVVDELVLVDHVLVVHQRAERGSTVVQDEAAASADDAAGLVADALALDANAGRRAASDRAVVGADAKCLAALRTLKRNNPSDNRRTFVHPPDQYHPSLHRDRARRGWRSTTAAGCGRVRPSSRTSVRPTATTSASGGPNGEAQFTWVESGRYPTPGRAALAHAITRLTGRFRPR